MQVSWTTTGDGDSLARSPRIQKESQRCQEEARRTNGSYEAGHWGLQEREKTQHWLWHILSAWRWRISQWCGSPDGQVNAARQPRIQVLIKIVSGRSFGNSEILLRGSLLCLHAEVELSLRWYFLNQVSEFTLVRSTDERARKLKQQANLRSDKFVFFLRSEALCAQSISAIV